MLSVSYDIYIWQVAENIVYVVCRLKFLFLALEVHKTLEGVCKVVYLGYVHFSQILVLRYGGSQRSLRASKIKNSMSRQMTFTKLESGCLR